MFQKLAGLVVAALLVTAAAWADPPEATAPATPGPGELASTVGLAPLSGVLPQAGSCAARDAFAATGEAAFLPGISELAAEPDTGSAEAGTFCTRAIDPFCIACYIGCPEGCWCECGDWFAQCCCDVT